METLKDDDEIKTITSPSEPIRLGLPKIRNKLKPWLSILVFFGFFFTCFTFVFQVVLCPITVIGYSMQPTINVYAEGSLGNNKTDTVYYHHARLEEIAYKDIIIVSGTYSTEGHSIIKRVIALPTQTITIKAVGDFEIIDYVHFVPIYKAKCVVEVNGEELDESYIKEDMFLELYERDSVVYSFYNTMVTSIKNTRSYSYTLQENEIFVMGDNRNHSTDSRYFGPIKYENVIGKVLIIVPYGSNLAISLWNGLLSLIY